MRWVGKRNEFEGDGFQPASSRNLVFLTDPSPRPSPRVRGEGENLEWDRNPGLRWRSTLG